MDVSKRSHSNHGHVCPWWLAYTFDNPLRKIFHKPQKMLGPYIKAGMKVMDIGCGMGFFSIGMAKLVGDKGKVFSVDLQPKMLEVTEKRAKRAGVAEQIFLHCCDPGKLGINEKVDFILTFWMVHEVKDHMGFFSQLQSNLNGGGKILTAEPKMHVSAEDFEITLAIAQSVGLQLCGQPPIRFSRTALLKID